MLGFVESKIADSERSGVMRTTQIATESSATDTGGIYQVAANIAPYYPGGGNHGGTPGTVPRNSVTGAAGALPVVGGLAKSTDVTAMRNCFRSISDQRRA